ncbi:hypothetical protein ACI65C_005163 [Semiaphis heraclei]
MDPVKKQLKKRKEIHAMSRRQFQRTILTKKFKCSNTLEKDSSCITSEVKLPEVEFSENFTSIPVPKLFEDTTMTVCSNISLSKSTSTSSTVTKYHNFNMPPTSKIDFDQILKVLAERKSNIFDEGTKLLKSPTDKCWKDVINELNFNISAKYLYLIVKENRHNILTKLKPTLDVNIQSYKQEFGQSEISEESSGHNDDLNSVSKLDFKMALSKDQWESIYDSVNSRVYKSDNMNTHDWSVHNIETNDDNVNEFNIQIEKNDDNVNELNLEIEQNYDNVNGFNLQIEKNDDNVNEFNIRIEKNDDNVNELNLEIEQNYDNVNGFNLQIEKNDDNVNELNLEIEQNYDNVNEFNLEIEQNYDNVNEFNLEIEKNDSFEDWRGLGKPITIKNVSCCVTNDLNNVPNNLITDFKKHINETVGKTEKTIKSKKKSNYLEKDPTVLFYNDRSKTKSVTLGILKNGNISDLNPVNIDGFSYTLTNTCAFDSLVHLICSSYVDSTQYSTYIDQEILHDFFELVSSASRDGINAQTYRKRVVILSKIMCNLRTWTEHPSGLRNFDCSCTIEFMIQNIFSNYFSLVSTRKCTNCSFTKKRKMVTISVKLPTENLDFLNDALSSMFVQDHETCRNCKTGNIELENEYGKQIFIEPYVPLTIGQNMDISIMLHEIPKTITIKQKLYNLRGMINFIPPASKKLQAAGHYITYCWRDATNKWEKYDDLSTSPRFVRPTSIATSCQILVYTI